MRKAIDRFWSWIFPPSMARFQHKDLLVTDYRNPSPGNIANFHLQQHDFREPYMTSKYNIRYAQLTPTQLESMRSTYAAQPLAGYSSPEEKLVAFGFLKAGQENNKELADKAKLDYFNKFKSSVEKAEFVNDFGYKMPIKGNRESFRYVVELGPISSRALLDILPGKSQEQIYNTTFMNYDFYDLYAGDPESQQTQIEVRYNVENYFVSSSHQARMGYIDIVRGNANFWKALDDSNDPSNIVAVQSRLRDQDPLDFQLKDKPIKILKDTKGNVVDMLP